MSTRVTCSQSPEGACCTPQPAIRWQLDPALRLRVSESLERGRSTLAELLADGRISSERDEDFWLIGDLMCEQPIGEALQSHVLGVECAGPGSDQPSPGGNEMQATDRSHTTGTAKEFSLLRRHTRALWLGQHVSREMARGRMLFDVLAEEPARGAIGELPCLLEDLMHDERVREMLDGAGGAGADRPLVVPYDGTPAARAAIAAAGSLFPGAAALILAIWQPGKGQATVRAAGHPVMHSRLRRAAAADLNAPATSAAAVVARQGCEHAREAGLSPRPLAIPAGSFEEAVAHVAGEWVARAIVVGSYRRTLLGRLIGESRIDAGRLAHAARVPVLVAPRADVAAVPAAHVSAAPPAGEERTERHAAVLA